MRVLKMGRGATATKFGANFSRALQLAMGMEFFTSESISLCGYMLDCEVLLGRNRGPIKIPPQWRNRTISDILKMFDIWNSDTTKESSPEILSQIKKIDNKISSYSTKNDTALVNLASDWGKYIMPATPKVARKMVFELNGPRHYAVNAPKHIIGKDIVKQRQLEALGWDVIQVCSIIIVDKIFGLASLTHTFPPTSIY